jgi:hypothetical protein
VNTLVCEVYLYFIVCNQFICPHISHFMNNSVCCMFTHFTSKPIEEPTCEKQWLERRWMQEPTNLLIIPFHRPRPVSFITRHTCVVLRVEWLLLDAIELKYLVVVEVERSKPNRYRGTLQLMTCSPHELHPTK